jgi:hypothetical protein
MDAIQKWMRTTKWIKKGECMNIKNPLRIIMMNQNRNNNFDPLTN